jgi:hypothetical protein
MREREQPCFRKCQKLLASLHKPLREILLRKALPSRIEIVEVGRILKGKAMPRLSLACLVVLAMAVVGCQSAGRFESPVSQSVRPATDVAAVPRAAGAAASAIPAVADAASPAPTPATALNPGRKIIYTAAFALVVKNIDEALESTRQMAERAGGYIQSMKGAEIIVRVPSVRFNEAAASLAALGHVVSKEIGAQDVTESYADLEVRIKAAKAVMDEFAKLLDRSANVEEALRVEREIGRVRSEIEQMEGVLMRMSHEVTYATLTVRFSAAPAPAPLPQLRVSLPVPWLKQIGLDNLMNIVGM